MGRVLVQQPGTNTTKASTEILPKNVIIVDEDLHQLRLHDGTTPGGHVIGSSGGGNNSNALLSFMWADHQLNDVSWLRADTFSWQSGDVYVAAYDHLVDDFENAQTTAYYAWTGEGFIAGTQETVYTTSQVPSVGDTVYYYGSDGLFLRYGTVATASSANITFTYAGDGATSSSMAYGGETLLPVHLETIGGITIAYRLAQDGHKITTHETDAVAIYNTTGVAWYYILDTTNRQFKLPRTKWGFTGIRSGVGGYVEAGLPNITGSFSTASDKNLGTGAFSWTDNKYSTNGGGKGGQWGINFSAKKSNPIYGNSDTVQPKATEMYLYFYVGNFEQSAIEQTAGLNAEMFNDLNAHKVIEFQASTSANNYTWYRKYADGWVEQGGQFIATSVADGSGTAGNNIINLPIEMANNRYWYSANIQVGSNGWDYANGVILNARSTTTMTLKAVAGTGTLGLHWEVKGMAAQ